MDQVSIRQMPRQRDWQENLFKVDRRARQNTRLKTRRTALPTDTSLPRSRDRPLNPEAVVKANARHFQDPIGTALDPYLPRPELKILRHLAFCCRERSSLLDPFEASRYADALVVLSAYWRDWLRPLDAWEPPAEKADAQFSSLLRHLLADYDVPNFMDAAWRAGLTAEGVREQNWFMHIGRGQSIRTADDLPVPLTKRMAHHFIQSPPDVSIMAAFRYGQVLGLGGDEGLARSLLGTRIGTVFDANDFWETVIYWLVEHPDIEPVHHGPIIDFLHDQRFVPSVPAGLVRGQRRLVPPRPNLCMRGRCPESLLRAVAQWHRQLAARREWFTSWKPSSLTPLRLTEDGEGGQTTYAVTELISSSELEEEGAAMGHCVTTYRPLCQSGQCSIWSLTAEDGSGRVERLLTLEVQNWLREIVQARGRLNRWPYPEELRILTRWASVGGPTLAQQVLYSVPEY